MSNNGQTGEHGEEIRIPTNEEEVPGRITSLEKIGNRIFGTKGSLPAEQDIKKRLEAKDSTAYDLTRICIFVVAGIWFIDYFFEGNSDSTDQVIDLLKYVITASLGFFFGSSKQSQKNNEDEK